MSTNRFFLFRGLIFVLQSSKFRQTNSSTPSIILQRFSNDYGVRLASHDVTNEIVKINGDEVDGLNLICIHSKPVVWKKFTESRRRVLDKMNTRHKSWVLLKPKELENVMIFYCLSVWNTNSIIKTHENMNRAGMNIWRFLWIVKEMQEKVLPGCYRRMGCTQLHW